VVGSLVAEAQRSGQGLRPAAHARLKDEWPAVAARLDELFDPARAVAARAARGGTAPAAVRASLAEVRRRLGEA
jgi:argininosuccinate lyase